MATILIVDDLAANRELLVDLLRHEGHRLLEAADGARALAAARAEPPALVITDVLMPVMDGYELVRQLRLDPATRGIPVVFCTAHYGEREARELAVSSGVAWVLTKPVEPQEVLRAVAHVLGGGPETGGASASWPLETQGDREHLRLLTDRLSEEDEDLRGANARLRALINIGLELASEREPDRLLESVCAAARDLFGASYVTLGLVDRENHTLQRLCTCGAADAWIAPGEPVPGILGTVVAERRTVRGENPGGDPTVQRLPPLHPELRTFLAAPVASPGHVYGWICLVGNEGRGFSGTDEDLVMALSGQVGRIYENGHFYRIARRRADALEREVREREAAEAELRLERDRAQRYLDTAEVILLALDADARVTLVNRYACAMLGWTAEELAGRDWIDTCLPEGSRAEMRGVFRKVLAGELTEVENVVVTRSGAERVVEWRSTVLRDDAGAATGTFSSGTDVTERRHAEEEGLRHAVLSVRAEREFRALFADNPLAMWIYDLSTLRFLEVNDAAVERYGYGRAEFLAMTLHDIRPPEDAAALDAHLRLPREPWEDSGSWRHQLKSGRVIDVQVTSHTITFGGRRSALVVAQDITERKGAEEEIRVRARLSALGGAVGLALTEADSLGRALQQCAEALVDHLDAAFARIWTLDGNEAVLELQASAGLYTHLDGPHGRIPLGEKKIGRIARERRPHLTNAVVGDPRVGDPAWARAEGMVAFAGHPLVVDGHVVGVMALFARQALSEAAAAALASVADHVALGIERHRAADALRAAEERMRFALESANVGIWDFDYATGELRWSETLEAHYGLAGGTFAGNWEAFVARVHPEDREALVEAIDRASQTGADFSVQNRSLRADGTVRWLRGAGRVVLGDDGRPARAVGISIDFTERRTLEERYQQAQKMEAIGRLAGGVAHDFNNVLTVVTGYSDLLLSSDTLDAEARELVREIAGAGERAASLTRQLLAFSRKQVLDPRVIDLNQVVARAEAMLRRVVGEDVALSTALSPGLFPIRADPGQMEQIVMNLVVNARDAMPRGGSLTLETANLEDDERTALPQAGLRPGRHVMLAVSDTGVGMPPEVLAHLFEPFFSTKGAEGTGLGLATVHGIVQQSGGYVSVYSEPGMGSTFKIYLPAADEGEAAARLGPPPGAPPRGTETVLLVEDEEGVRALCRSVLRSCGYTVLDAADADEALQAAATHRGGVSLLLTDVVMPRVGGRRLAEQVEALCPGLAVLYMSGYTDDAVIRHGVLQADTAFLQKPFTPAALAAKVRQVLDRAAAAGADPPRGER